MSNIYTDLAVELHDLATQSITHETQLEGVSLAVESIGQELQVTTVDVLTSQGEQTMGKPMGRYITIDSPGLKHHDPTTHQQVTELLAKRLPELYSFTPNTSILVVGLGNSQVTPDTLGPRVLEKILVTRHIPKDHLHELLGNNLRTVSAIAPGVMGQTGMSTVDIIRGVVDKTRPDVVIAIDALASRATSRINATIQMTNTGISPGSGLEDASRPLSLNEAVLGVPVLAIGVPTVVDAATLINDSLEAMIVDLKDLAPQDGAFYDMLQALGVENRYPLIRDLLAEQTDLFVTPREVDIVLDRLSQTIAHGLNLALHPGINVQDVELYSY